MSTPADNAWTMLVEHVSLARLAKYAAAALEMAEPAEESDEAVSVAPTLRAIAAPTLRAAGWVDESRAA